MCNCSTPHCRHAQRPNLLARHDYARHPRPPQHQRRASSSQGGAPVKSLGGGSYWGPNFLRGGCLDGSAAAATATKERLASGGRRHDAARLGGRRWLAGLAAWCRRPWRGASRRAGWRRGVPGHAEREAGEAALAWHTAPRAGGWHDAVSLEFAEASE
jgi:hypothetical protein